MKFFKFHFQIGEQKIVGRRYIQRVRGCNIFWGQIWQTLALLSGRIFVQQKKISKAGRNWTNPLNALQEAIHYSFMKFCIYCFALLHEFFLHYPLKVKKNYKHVLDAGPLEFQFLRRRGYLTKPFRTLSLCIGVKGKTPGLNSCKNVAKKFVCIGHRDNGLARCDSLFPLLRCQGVWNKMCTQLSPSIILFQNHMNYSVVDVQRFCYHS